MTEEEIKEYWRSAYYNEKHKKEELEKENAELKSVLSKCYSKFFSNAFRTCDDDLLELKGQIKNLLKE